MLMYDLQPFSKPFKRSEQARDILILGSGRSGTTWLMELLLCLPGYRGVYEPFQPDNVSHFPQTPHFTHKYLNEHDSEPDLKEYFRRLYHEELDTDWWCGVARYNRRPERTQTVLKTIRGVLMATWLQANFPVITVTIRRDPVKVVWSWRRLRWVHLGRLETFLEQPALMEEHLASRREHLEKLALEGGEAERMAAFWWVENFVLGRTVGPDALRVSYRTLVEERESELERICESLGYEVPEFLSRRSFQKSLSSIRPGEAPGPAHIEAVEKTVAGLGELPQ
jgi:hypothetical protein